jgi:hypothetical protein
MNRILVLRTARSTKKGGVQSMIAKGNAIVFFLLILFSSGCLENTSIKNSSGVMNLILQRGFDLARVHSSDRRYYLVETKLVKYNPDGKRSDANTYALNLEYVPAELSGKNESEYICRKFHVQLGSASPSLISALEDWSYVFKWGYDEEGRVFGIDHTKFEKLETEEGITLPPDVAYFVYNTFIDFHSFCNILAQSTPKGKGIQHLKKIGERIIHASAFTEPPVNLGSNVMKGSRFTNGEVTLELKGISYVDGMSCALVTFDSGESSFEMIMSPFPKIATKTVGGSHYKGDLYIDLESNWVQKVEMWEIIVHETTLPIPPYKINSVTERTTHIQSLSKRDFFMGSN